VTSAVQRVDAAARVEVDLPAKAVTVESSAPRERLAAAIRDEGYAVAG
jgi:copper chaperone